MPRVRSLVIVLHLDFWGRSQRSLTMRYRGLLGLFSWSLTLFTSAFWVYWVNDFDTKFVWLTAGRLSEHWFLIASTALTILMVAGRFGASLGIPHLFHDEPEAKFTFFRSPAFWGAFEPYRTDRHFNNIYIYF